MSSDVLREWIDSYRYRPYDRPATVDAAEDLLNRVEAVRAVLDERRGEGEIDADIYEDLSRALQGEEG